MWLPKFHEGSASATRHPFCVGCGTVRNLALPRAMSLAYYLNSLARLKDYLDHSPLQPRLVQVQSHLIAERLTARPEFEDPYGTQGQAQVDAYVFVVQSVRPDLDEELLLRVLRLNQRRKAPVMDSPPRNA